MEELRKKGFVEVLYVLESGDQRYSEVAAQVDLAPATLSRRLREATGTGLVRTRASTSGTKPVIVYGLSSKGSQVVRRIKALNESLKE